MSSNIKKPSVCNRCYTYVNWSEAKRKELNTRRPLNQAGTDVHECPKDNQGNIIINYEVKAIYDAAVAGTTAGNPGQTSLPVQQQQVQGQGQLTNYDISQILAIMTAQVRELSDQQKKFTDAIMRMETVIESQRKLLTDYIQYDPVGQQLNGLIETLLKYIPEPELRPRPANEILTPSVSSGKKRSLKDIEKLEEDEYLARREHVEDGD